MRKFFLVATAAASMFAVGCTSPEAVCETQANATCDKVFECSSAEAKSSDFFKAAFGTSAADCKTKMIAAAKCSEMKEYDQMCTGEDAGKKFDLGNASDCLDAFKAESCADLNAGKSPAACEQVCK